MRANYGVELYRVQSTYLYAECGHILMQRTHLIVQLCNASSFLTRFTTLQIQTVQRTRFRTDVHRRCDWPLPFDALTHRCQRFSTANAKKKRNLFVSTFGRRVTSAVYSFIALNQYLPLQEFAMAWTRCGMQWWTYGTFGRRCIRHVLRIGFRLIFVVFANWWQHQRRSNVWFGLFDRVESERNVSMNR